MAKAKEKETVETVEVKDEKADLKALLRGLIVEALSEGKDPEEVEAMALAEAEAKGRQEKEEAYYSELVPFRAFKGEGKYKDDIIVGVNGKLWQIKRGEIVTIPRSVLEVIENSEHQDSIASDYMEEQQDYYASQAKARNL